MKQDEWGLYILDGKWVGLPMQTDKPAEPA